MSALRKVYFLIGQILYKQGEEMEVAFLNMYTAANLGDKHARAYVAIFLENGMFPSKEILITLVGQDKPFEYMVYLTDIMTLFKQKHFSIKEFQQEMKGKAFINLYLSSLVDLQPAAQEDQNDFSKIDNDQNLDSLMAQMILGHKFYKGIGVQEKCSASALYYEEAALQTIKYVEKSNALNVVELNKLSIGLHVL